MATEARRACGYRKVGGLYLCGSGSGITCDRLPLPLVVCPCCGQGIKSARGWTWIDLQQLVEGPHLPECIDPFACPLCLATVARAGLIWIGQVYYKTPAEFMAEAQRLGISRRIPAVPRGLKLGETWVALAHAAGAPCPTCKGTGLFRRPALPCIDCEATGRRPGMFYLFKPSRIEKIITETMSHEPGYLDELRNRGLTPVIVPDDDADHRPLFDKADQTEE